MKFSASIIFGCFKLPEDLLLDCEEKIILLDADSESHANLIACDFGKNANFSYVAASEKTVEWRFLGVSSVDDLGWNESASPAEVFARLFDPKFLPIFLDSYVAPIPPGA